MRGGKFKMESFELKHYGIKGMRWGVRKKRTITNHEDYQKAHSKKSVQEMSDKELRERNNRLQMEQQYAQMTKKKNRGKQVITAIVATAATLKALEGAYKTYKNYGNAALDKVGDWVVSGIDLSGPLH
jgi:hypothetical protein